MVCGDDDVRRTKVVYNDSNEVFKLLNGFVASKEYIGFISVSCFVDLVVMDVHDIHALDEFLSVSSLHANDVLVMERDAVRVCALENTVTVVALGRLTVCKYHEAFLVLVFDRQRSMRQKCRHTELCYRREHALHTVELNLTLCFSLKLLG